MKDISKILKSIGLVDSEVKTYLQALQHGPSTVIDLAKHTSLSRQATYVAIESLTERGLMSSVQRGKKNYYVAEAPAKLLAYAQRRQKEMEDEISDLAKAVPELELQVGGEKPVVTIFEGKEGIKALLEETKSAKPKQLDEITDTKAMYHILTQADIKPYRDELKKSKTMIRTAYNGNPLPSEPMIQRQVIDQNFKAHISAFGDKVTMMTFEGKMHSIMIESRALAQAMRALFDLAFKKSR